MTKHSSVITVLAILLVGTLAGCAGAAVGAGATAGTAAVEERGLSGALDDTKIRIKINELWFRQSEEMYRKVSLTIVEGRVLLTGVVPTEEARADAVRLSWQAEGVREVLNEIQVSPDGQPFWDQSRDIVISQKLKQKLLWDSEIKNINYSIDVVDGVVYLIGLAQNEAELERVIAYARDISNVKRVVNYVRMKTDPRRVSG